MDCGSAILHEPSRAFGTCDCDARSAGAGASEPRCRGVVMDHHEVRHLVHQGNAAPPSTGLGQAARPPTMVHHGDEHRRVLNPETDLDRALRSGNGIGCLDELLAASPMASTTSSRSSWLDPCSGASQSPTAVRIPDRARGRPANPMTAIWFIENVGDFIRHPTLGSLGSASKFPSAPPGSGAIRRIQVYPPTRPRATA